MAALTSHECCWSRYEVLNLPAPQLNLPETRGFSLPKSTDFIVLGSVPQSNLYSER